MITRYRKRLMGHLKEYLRHNNEISYWIFIINCYCKDVYQLPLEFLIWVKNHFIIKVTRYEKKLYDIKDLDKVLNIFICIIQRIRVQILKKHKRFLC